MDQSDLLNQLRIDRNAAPAPSESRLWLIVSIVIGVIVVAALLGFVLTRTPPPTVKVAAAVKLSGAPSSASVLDATGYVTARRQATVSSKITGKVLEVMIEEGQHVSEGEVLATLEDVDAQAQLGLVQAQLESSRSQLAEIRTNLANAEREYQRATSMAERKLVSVQAVDTARTQAEALRARLASAERVVAVAAQSLHVAEVNLDSTIVRAPFTGVITVKAAQPGEMISPISAGGGSIRTGIGTVVDMDSLEVQVDVNEAYINRVLPDQPVEAVLNAYPDWKIPAHVIAIVPTADRSKATVKVRVAMDVKDTRIVPDMGVRVSFLEEHKPAAAGETQAPKGVLLPAEALRREGERDIVFVVRDGKAQRRAVTLGGNVGGSRQVLGGVAVGEQAIVDGPADLKDGDTVKVQGSQ